MTQPFRGAGSRPSLRTEAYPTRAKRRRGGGPGGCYESLPERHFFAAHHRRSRPFRRRAGAQTVLDKSLHHLGTPGDPEWDEFSHDKAEGRSLELRFASKGKEHENTLFLRQRDVKLDWDVRLNGRSLGKLLPYESDLTLTLTVPAGVLRDGENVLTVGPPSGPDDIVVGEVALDPKPRDEAINRATLEVRVSDRPTGYPIPCRITVVDERGVLAPLVVKPDRRLAVRTGVVYTLDARVRIGLRPGKYTVYATRGPTYSLAKSELTITDGEDKLIYLAILEEVDTRDLVSCDTHVHTLTYSGHGDANVDERVVTLAGEGVALPVATDHDHLTDFGPAVKSAQAGADADARSSATR